MAKTKSGIRQQAAQQPTPPTQDEMDEESDVEFQLDGELEADETEQELEKLVFGDSAGFRQGLRGFALDEEEQEEEDGARQTGLEGLEDADVGQGHLRTRWEACGLTGNSSSSPIRVLQTM